MENFIHLRVLHVSLSFVKSERHIMVNDKNVISEGAQPRGNVISKPTDVVNGKLQILAIGLGGYLDPALRYVVFDGVVEQIAQQ
jgi:hypothetical protein